MPFDRRERSMNEEAASDDGVQKKRRRGPDINEIESHLENLIVRVGEKSTSSLESNLEGLAQVLETDLDTYKGKIIHILKLCVMEMPEKLTIYSTLVGLLNAKNYNFGGEFVEMLMRQLRKKLMDQNYEYALRIIVFLCDLVNCRVVSAHSCLGFLEGLIEVAFTEGIPQVRSDFFVYTVLHSLPWTGLELSERKRNELIDMLEAVERYLEQRQKLHVQMLRVWTSNRPHPQEEYLDCLWAQIKRLRSENWMEKQISRHYIAFDAVLSEALQHNLPSFIPAGHQDTSVYPQPTVVFRLFDYTDCPENGPVLPGTHSIERFLVERELNWIVCEYYANRKECANMLINYPKRSKVPLNYMILEVLFGQMFRLPTSPCPQIFYGSLLIELCKLQPNTMPQVLAQAAELLYQRVDTMQPACFDRFVDWFSYHLSNFQYRWSWADWEDSLQGDTLAPKKVFVIEVLAKCMRFSYHQRVVEIVPENFAELLPEKSIIEFKYGGDATEDTPGKELAHKIAQAIKARCSADEALQLIKEYPNPDQMSECNALAVEVFVSVLLNLGSKSFSHSFAALTRYHQTLKALTDNNEEAQMIILRTVHNLWNTHQQMMIVLVDKLLKMQIVECNCVVAWIFGERLKPDFLRMYVWEIMLSALVKLSRHVQRLHSEMEHSREQLAEQEKSQPKIHNEPEDEPMEKEENDENGDKSGGEEEKVTSEMISEMNQKFQAAEDFQKNLLLSVFHKFTIILTEHLLNCESEGRDFNTSWYRWVTGRFRQIFMEQSEEIWKICTELEASLFTNEIDGHILEIFHQFRALRR